MMHYPCSVPMLISFCILEFLDFIACFVLSLPQLWTPCARVPSMVAGGESGPDTADSLQVMADNQNQMRRHREIGL